MRPSRSDSQPISGGSGRATAPPTTEARSEVLTVTLQLAPATLVLGSPGTWVTAHAEISYHDVDVNEITLAGITPVSTFADSRGELVAKFARTDVEAVASPPEAALTLEGVTLAYLGDGNNVAHSLLLAASLSGMNFRIASPRGYQVQEKILRLAQGYAAESGSEILCTEEPNLAVSEADIVYTDVWASMGQEAEAEQRRRIFAGYQVNDELLSLAKEDAILMHPLPAHHGEEVAENILYSPQSVVFDQAENRIHLQKALLLAILGGLEIPLAD